MIVFYNTATSPNGLKVRLMLEECGLEFEQRILRRDKGENKTPEYLRISPTGTVPAIVDQDNGLRMFESAAILLYLAEKSGRYLPAGGPQRAVVLQWLMFEVATISALGENIYQLSYMNNSEPWLAKQTEKLRDAASVLDTQLIGKDYICGECSIADFALLPWLLMFDDLAGTPLSDFNRLYSWRVTMQQRPLVATVLGRQ